jgi:putative cell wall-binding protein
LISDKINYSTAIIVDGQALADGLYGEADVMSIAPVAAKNGNPVILTDDKTTNYFKDVQAYSIGRTGVLNSYFDSFSERIGGKDRFETNANVINRFFPNKDHVNLSKSDVLIDVLTSSALKDLVVLINDNSDKSIIAGAKSATVFGDISQTTVNMAKSYIFNEKMNLKQPHHNLVY